VVLGNGVKITWLGHSTFMIVSPGGKIVLIDPWVMGNPACPETLKQFDALDLILITHGHFDHMGDAVELVRRHQPKVVAAYEICVWLEGKGVTNTFAMNKGGSQTIDGLTVTMVAADHSSGILDEGQIVYGGEPCGYILKLENRFTIYHAGDTNVLQEMTLIGELYRPDLALLPIGGHFTMGPKEAAYAVRLLGTRCVIPMHYGTFPVLTGSPEQLRDLTADIEGLRIIALRPGETLE
jgi:L-ascorbate metabolism protein UlaG (beta-lactamase superfamily)